MPAASRALEKLIHEFTKLPGIGPKTAERLVYYLLKQPKTELESLAETLQQVKKNISVCQTCFCFTEENPCLICSDKKRNRSLLCVVAESQNIPIIEKTGVFLGLYHVLGGLISPLEGTTPDKLHIQELETRLKHNGIKEVILALNPDLDGETTSLYLSKLIKSLGIKVTRLARGLPMGADLEYADEITLENAITGRREV